MIEQHLCYVKKCEQCQAMFSDEGDYTKHNKNCETFERIERFGKGDVDRCVEIVGIMDDEKYKDIPRNTWPELFKLGAEAFINQQTKTSAEKGKESGGDKLKETPVQIINTHNTYGEQVKAGQWGY